MGYNGPGTVMHMHIGGEPPEAETPYDAMGGAETVARLVDAFYRRVARHPDLAPIFPADLTEVRNKQYAFLTQFFGGPPLYSQKYGHPMLRRRHLPHPITPTRAKAWLACMNEALDEAGIEGELKEFLFARLTATAHHMVNTPDEAHAPGTGATPSPGLISPPHPHGDLGRAEG